ncbi:MAG TPA: electron transport complex subunit RsxD [Steroidobacteraceae bacterium]
MIETSNSTPAVDTPLPTLQPPHTIAPNSVSRVMRLVLIALAPAILLHAVFFGVGILVQVLLAIAAALAAEYVALRLRRQPVRKYLLDGSAVITAVLLAMCLPSLAPWWLVVSGTAFAILIAKHLYGGLGSNLFNPAMVGYAVLLVSFPVQLTRWPSPDVAGLATVDLTFLETLRTIFVGTLPPGTTWDAVTSPTPLDAVRTGLQGGLTLQEAQAAPTFGLVGGRGWEWVNLAVLGGGLWLLVLKIIRWHIPVAVLAGLAIPATIMHVIDPGSYAGAFFHLTAGASMLGAFFIATDPVSAATTDRGRLVYGFGIGLIAYTIRTWGGYPDGIAFAVLLMNLAVPLIDRYTVPRIYGRAT